MRETCSAHAVAAVTHATSQHEMLPYDVWVVARARQTSPEVKNNWLHVNQSYLRRRLERERDIRWE
jgi:hypothetical protein